MAQRSESICLRRFFCGVWRSKAGGVVVRFCCFCDCDLFLFVCVSACLSDCSVPHCFCSCTVFSLVSVVLVRHIDGRKVQRNSVASNFANYSFECAVVVVMFSCVRNS